MKIHYVLVLFALLMSIPMAGAVVIQPSPTNGNGWSWASPTALSIISSGEYTFAPGVPSQITLTVTADNVKVNGAGVTFERIIGNPTLDLSNITVNLPDDKTGGSVISQCRDISDSSISVSSTASVTGIRYLFGKAERTTIELESQANAYVFGNVGTSDNNASSEVVGGTFSATAKNHAYGIGFVGSASENVHAGLWGTVSGGEFYINGDQSARSIRLMPNSGGKISGGTFWSKSASTAVGITDLQPPVNTPESVVVGDAKFYVWANMARGIANVMGGVEMLPTWNSVSGYSFESPFDGKEYVNGDASNSIISTSGAMFWRLSGFKAVGSGYTISGIGEEIVNGSISPTLPQSVDVDGSITFTITPDDEYVLDKIFVNGGEKQPTTTKPVTYVFENVNEDYTFHVTFKKEVTYTIDIDGPAPVGGSIYPPLPHTVVAGDYVEFIIKPDCGYLIANLTVDGDEIIPPTPIVSFDNVDKDHIINVTFEADPDFPETFNIKASGFVPQGCLNGDRTWDKCVHIVPTEIHVAACTEYVVSFDSKAGYRISAVMIDGVPITDAERERGYIEREAIADHNIIVIAVPRELPAEQLRVTLTAFTLDDGMPIEPGDKVPVLTDIIFIGTSIGLRDPVEWSFDFGDCKLGDNCFGKCTVGVDCDVFHEASDSVFVIHKYTMPGIYTPSVTGVNDVFSGTETKIGFINITARQ